MRDQATVKKHIEEEREKLAPFQGELRQLEEQIAPQKKIIDEKIAELEKTKADKLKSPSSREIRLWLSILGVAVVVMLFNIILMKIPYLTFVAIALGVVSLCIWSTLDDKEKTKITEKYDAEIAEERKKYTALYNAFPRIMEIEKQINGIEEDIARLENELEAIELQGSVGENNLFVYVDVENGQFQGIRETYMAYMIVDGVERGQVASPFSIVHLSEGVHSVLIKLYLPKTGEYYFSKEDQFSLKGSTRFVVYNQIMCSPSLGCTFAHHKCETASDFIRYASISKYAFDRYLQNL